MAVLSVPRRVVQDTTAVVTQVSSRDGVPLLYLVSSTLYLRCTIPSRCYFLLLFSQKKTLGLPPRGSDADLPARLHRQNSREAAARSPPTSVRLA